MICGTFLTRFPRIQLNAGNETGDEMNSRSNININKELGSPSIEEIGMGMSVGIAGSMVSITDMNMTDSLPALTPASSDGKYMKINGNMRLMEILLIMVTLM